jgi:hypothetical protein
VAGMSEYVEKETSYNEKQKGNHGDHPAPSERSTMFFFAFPKKDSNSKT